MTDSSTHLKAIWPGGDNAVKPITPATRPPGLAGKRIGFLWDHMFRGDEIFPLLERQLKAEYGEVEFVSFDQFGPTFGGDEHAVLDALPARLRDLKVDAVISGIGA